MLALLLAPLVVPTIDAFHPFCPAQPHHQYVLGGSVGATLTSLSREPASGTVSVQDSNVSDCDGDGDARDYDGDLDLGAGGAAFGYGPFAATCGHHVHGGSFLVLDPIATAVPFFIGADDQAGGTPHPVTGDPACMTNGLISPSDPDDCITPLYYGSGDVGSCTGGGDGLVWIFLSAVEVMEDISGSGASASDPPLTGTVTAF